MTVLLFLVWQWLQIPSLYFLPVAPLPSSPALIRASGSHSMSAIWSCNVAIAQNRSLSTVLLADLSPGRLWWNYLQHLEI